VLAANLIAARGRSTLVLVHRKPLVEQWTDRLCEFLDIGPKSIGRLGGGRRRLTKQIDIAMVQTLARRDDLHDLVRAYGHVVIDECHHVPAIQVERVLSAIPARYITGLTATPYRRGGHQPIITMQCGPVRHAISSPTDQTPHPLVRRLIRKDTSFDPTVLPPQASIQEIYAALVNDTDRLQIVLTDIRELVREGRAVVALTERRDRLARINESLCGEMPNLVVRHGGGGSLRPDGAMIRTVGHPTPATRSQVSPKSSGVPRIDRLRPRPDRVSQRQFALL
jgi:superfamily II DNA or RNA helicase